MQMVSEAATDPEGVQIRQAAFECLGSSASQFSSMYSFVFLRLERDILPRLRRKKRRRCSDTPQEIMTTAVSGSGLAPALDLHPTLMSFSEYRSRGTCRSTLARLSRKSTEPVHGESNPLTTIRKKTKREPTKRSKSHPFPTMVRT